MFTQFWYRKNIFVYVSLLSTVTKKIAKKFLEKSVTPSYQFSVGQGTISSLLEFIREPVRLKVSRRVAFSRVFNQSDAWLTHYNILMRSLSPLYRTTIHYGTYVEASRTHSVSRTWSFEMALLLADFCHTDEKEGND